MTSRSETTNPVAAMREIETIRETIAGIEQELRKSRNIVPHVLSLRALESLSTLEARIAELEVCALDLTKVPSGWQFDALIWESLAIGYGCTIDKVGDKGNANSVIEYGPTPRTALEAAIGRIPK